ncbi:MAG: DUF308 domain-containing protein [Lachnospiraceae bacterium]|nr:DUF308 domain-containing protein [Lachnospiraceae bacterium]
MKSIKEKARYLLTGLAEFLLGIVLFLRPMGFTQGVLMIAGVLLLVAGVIQIVSYFRTAPEAAKGHSFSKGIFSLAMGRFLILRPDTVLAAFPALRMLYGVLFFLLAALKLQWTADFLRFHKHQWLFALLSSALACVTAALVFRNPAWISDVLATLIPIALIAEAILDVLALFYKGSLTTEQPQLRKTENLNNANWRFKKNFDKPSKHFPSRWEGVTLPHTWNALDGQDGGNDYFRGKCVYAVRIPRQKTDGRVWLEIEAASLMAEVYINGQKVAQHAGGYSAFRADVTDYLTKRKNLLCILVDNENREDVYPQMADFTFFGGLYRGVNLITVPQSHFSLDRYGADGFLCTPISDEIDTRIRAEAWLDGTSEGDTVHFSVADAEGLVVAQSEIAASEYVCVDLHIPQPHFWQGVDDPYLYTVSATLLRDGEVIDGLHINTGIRTFAVDPQKGFILNGIPTPLRGVARHQDREDKGYAISWQDQQEDAALIREVGANTVRLAHYQHSQAFYDECDRLGLIVWAEIPLISVMSENPDAHENSLQQMKELISQCYNHPSICFWGIANEITLGGETAMTETNLRELNQLVHDMDSVRLTTMAQFSAYPTDGALNQITDVLSYNHYFGWYSGSFEDNEAWLDAFHAKYPDRPIGLSEYGCEAITAYHSDAPRRRDYTEEYQALYHEHMAQIILERPWLWATYVWNMFDFAADSRDEGGVKGRNNKGLVTMDRRIKKDAFYLYKAWWSDEPFVHICGRRYKERSCDTLSIKVYSNQPEITLYLDGSLVEEKSAARVFLFENLPFTEGSHVITAKYHDLEDTIVLTRVEQENPVYHFAGAEDGDTVVNWFEDQDTEAVPELCFADGFYSIRDTIGDILGSEQAKEVFLPAVSSLVGMKIDETTLAVMSTRTIEDLAPMLGTVGASEEKIAMLNAALQKVKKEEAL